MIGTGEVAVIGVAPLAGYAAERWAASWDRRLDLPAGPTSPQALPLPVTIALAVAIAAIAAVAQSGLFAGLGALLGWSLLALALVDRRHHLLPNLLTLPLIAGGLAVAAVVGRELPVRELVGAGAGYAFFWACRRLHWHWRGREGLGLGDAKLLAAGGAWLGWQPLPLVVLLASLSALLATLPAIRRGGERQQAEIAFGPHLALAIWALWLYDPEGFF